MLQFFQMRLGFLILIAAVLSGCGSWIGMSGGPCSYETYEGEADIIAVDHQPANQRHEFRLRFILPQTTGAHQSPDQVRRIKKLNGWEFTKSANHPNLTGAQLGDRFHVQASMITQGTCTPVGFMIKSSEKPTMAAVYFASDSAQVDVAGQLILMRFARDYKRSLDDGHAVRIVLAGNTGQKGNREYNLALGFRMADSVRLWLLRLGVRGEDIETTSFGEERPQCSASMDEGCQSQNRRVELMIR